MELQRDQISAIIQTLNVPPVLGPRQLHETKPQAKVSFPAPMSPRSTLCVVLQ